MSDASQKSIDAMKICMAIIHLDDILSKLEWRLWNDEKYCPIADIIAIFISSGKHLTYILSVGKSTYLFFPEAISHSVSNH